MNAYKGSLGLDVTLSIYQPENVGVEECNLISTIIIISILVIIN